MRKTLLAGLALLFACFSLGGCLYSREIAHTRHDLERAYPSARFEREIVLNFGPVSLFSARLLTGLMPSEAQEMRPYLRSIRRVKVGVYRTEGLPPLGAADLPRLGRLRERGWETLAAVREEDEAVWVLYRERRGSVRDVYVLALGADELVVVRLKGRLDRLIRHALEEHGGEIDVSDWSIAGR